MPIVAEMFGQLDIQRRLEHLLGQPGQQPARPGQLHTLRSSGRHQLIGQHGQIRRHRPLTQLRFSDLCGHA